MTRIHARGSMTAAIVAFMGLFLYPNAFAQAPKFQRGPAVHSPEVMPDGRITFRILAPEAAAVGLQASDVPSLLQNSPQFTKDKDGVWESTIGPIAPGAYRYRFMVNGVAVVDPQNPSVSESNANVWSLVYVPGAEFMEAGRVRHGAVAVVHYYSTALKRHRRMHVYTPPDYEADQKKYPVFYLLHGAMDCDNSWSTVGRAGFILDNLIAQKKAKPMIVVMPAGHTSKAFQLGGGEGMESMVDEFGQDFVKDVMPYIEANYRTLADRGSRAMAGLSMGGMQTLEITMADLGKFSYIGVFSSGIFSLPPAFPADRRGPAPPASNEPGWEKEHAAMLNDAGLKKGLKLLWFATGSDDFLVGTTKATVEMLKKHGFSPVFKETDGGHTWINWRNYLNEFAQQLFQ